MAKSSMKTRVTAASKDARPAGTQPVSIRDVDIALRAYEIYRARGREHGHAIDDWLQAELHLARKGSR